MAEDWTAEQLAAYNDFVKDGFAITVRVPGGPGTFNPVTLKYVGATDNTDYETYGLKKSYKVSEIDNTIVQSGDTLLYFPAYELPDINTDHQILISGAVFEIVNIQIIDPGNVRLLYGAQIRG